MKKLIFASLFLTASAFAALPPYWDSVERLSVVLKSPEVSRALANGPIASIFDKGNLTYEISTPHCTVLVKVAAKLPSSGRVGATTYVLDKVLQAQCM